MMVSLCLAASPSIVSCFSLAVSLFSDSNCSTNILLCWAALRMDWQIQYVIWVVWSFMIHETNNYKLMMSITNIFLSLLAISPAWAEHIYSCSFIYFEWSIALWRLSFFSRALTCCLSLSWYEWMQILDFWKRVANKCKTAGCVSRGGWAPKSGVEH